LKRNAPVAFMGVVTPNETSLKSLYLARAEGKKKQRISPVLKRGKYGMRPERLLKKRGETNRFCLVPTNTELEEQSWSEGGLSYGRVRG